MDAIKPILTHQDYAEAIIEIQRLWAAEPGTPDHDRLEALGTLVDAYEAKRWCRFKNPDR